MRRALNNEITLQFGTSGFYWIYDEEDHILHRLPTRASEDLDNEVVLTMTQPIIVAGGERREDKVFMQSSWEGFNIGHIIYCGNQRRIWKKFANVLNEMSLTCRSFI